MSTSLPSMAGWYAPLSWPVRVSSEARFEWWIAWHYVQHIRGDSGSWDLGKHPA